MSQKITVHPLTPDRWDDFVSLFGDNGAYGVGQSSWGPAIYGLVEGKKQANNLESAVKSFLQDNGGGRVFIAGANNQGAIIKKV